MPRYVWDAEAMAFVDPETREPMPVPERDGVQCPQVIPDIPDYRSPVTGEVISGRRQRRDDLKRHNCVEYEPSLSPVNPERFGEKKRNTREAEKG